MNEDFESRLRATLRPVAPDEEFSRRLISSIGVKPPRRAARSYLRLGGIAAALIIGIGVQQHFRAQRELASGLEARRQVLQALQMTRQKLDLAYEAVKKQSSSLVDGESGA